MDICRNCYYFAPEEDRACKSVYCHHLEGEIKTLLRKAKPVITNEELIEHFGEAVNSIIREGAEMEERIVITNKEDIDYIEMYKNVYYTKEQVPETWEELEELCKDIKGVKVFGGCISIGEDSHETYFLKDGTIGKENGADVWWNTDIAQNRTPQQMWNIIKSLIGEE